MDTYQFIPFLIRAKQHTYASGQVPVASSRPNSHDLEYAEEKYRYIDTYLGGFHFIGEEAVWKKGAPIWGMNYYGKMLVEEIQAGFGEFLKATLMHVQKEAPYRGPENYQEKEFTYHCTWQGTVKQFEGWEEISFHDVLIYRLLFHGGEIRAE
jgi:Domain of unknown function (DUF5680)